MDHNLNTLIQSNLPLIFCAVGICTILIALFTKSKTEVLKTKGLIANGIIFELGTKNYSQSSFNEKGLIIVRFTTQTNEWITTDVKNNRGVYYSGQYKIGEYVKILYDPDKPAECVILTKQSEKTATIVTIIAGFIFCCIGVYKILTA